MKKFALIVAGGSGNRMNSEIPKQFLELNGRPVIMHTIDVFKRYDKKVEIILVLPKNQVALWNKLSEKHNFKTNCTIVPGGENRFQSVKNGLNTISTDGIVFIHDGVRPLVSIETIINCFETALLKGNSLPVVPVNESVRILEGNKNRSVDRSEYMLVQTPQTFKARLIQKAYEQAASDLFTDDATVLEHSGEAINLVPGNRENIKITYPQDLAFAESILSLQ